MMEIWLWPAAVILAGTVMILLIKIILLRKSAEEIENAFTDRLITDTNILIDISSRDKTMRNLADAVNRQLRILRTQRHRFEQGDLELKNAVTNISHDLRTPLTAMCGYLDLLEQEELSENAARYVDIIRSRTELLSLMTEELFRYSVILTPETARPLPEPVTVNPILEESIAAFYTALHAQGITPRIQMPETPVTRRLDPSALSRIFSNLLSNALKYSSGDLEIVLSETGEILFANNAPDLTEVQAGRLFDRFYTVENARTSTGLGLSITRTLVEQMGGNIGAEYKSGRLEIRIFFPNT